MQSLLDRIRAILRLGGGAVTVALPPARSISEEEEIYKKDARKTVYQFSVIALAARLALCDGPLNAREIDSFGVIFSPSPQFGDPKALLLQASCDKMNAKHYATRITSFFPHDEALYERIMRAMFRFAAVDSPLEPSEILFLRKLAECFSLSDKAFAMMLERYITPENIMARGSSPYDVLEVTKSVTHEQLRQKYYEAIRAYHPDKFSAVNADDKVIELANLRLSRINGAYQTIKKQKRFR